MKVESVIKIDRPNIRFSHFENNLDGVLLTRSFDRSRHQQTTHTKPRVLRFDGNVVDLRNACGDVEYDESDNFRAAHFVIYFSDETGGETVFVDKPIVA